MSQLESMPISHICNLHSARKHSLTVPTGGEDTMFKHPARDCTLDIPSTTNHLLTINTIKNILTAKGGINSKMCHDKK